MIVSLLLCGHRHDENDDNSYYKYMIRYYDFAARNISVLTVRELVFKKNPFKLLSYIIIIIKSWELNGSYFIYHYHFYRDQQLWIHPAGHLITIIMTWLFGINCDHMQLNFSSKGFGMYIMSPTKNNFNCHHKFNSKTRNCPSLIGLFPAKSLVSKMNKWISSHVSVVTVH